jgi:hypothetical protein
MSRGIGGGEMVQAKNWKQFLATHEAFGHHFAALASLNDDNTLDLLIAVSRRLKAKSITTTRDETITEDGEPSTDVTVIKEPRKRPQPTVEGGTGELESGAGGRRERKRRTSRQIISDDDDEQTGGA